MRTLLFLVVAFSLLAGCMQNPQPLAQTGTPTLTNVIENATVAVTLVINNGTVQETRAYQVEKGTTAYDFVKEHLQLKVREYGTIGVYIEAVNGLEENREGNHKFWQYYVDGEYAKVGVSFYRIDRPLTLELRYENPNEQAYT